MSLLLLSHTGTGKLKKIPVFTSKIQISQLFRKFKFSNVFFCCIKNEFKLLWASRGGGAGSGLVQIFSTMVLVSGTKLVNSSTISSI